MIKKISELTEQDKVKFMRNVKKSMLLEQGMPWDIMEPMIQADIDAAFDDEKFAKMDPEFAVDAAYMRREFGKKKPSIVDYMLWSAKFVTHSEYVDIGDD